MEGGAEGGGFRGGVKRRSITFLLKYTERRVFHQPGYPTECLPALTGGARDLRFIVIMIVARFRHLGMFQKEVRHCIPPRGGVQYSF